MSDLAALAQVDDLSTLRTIAQRLRHLAITLEFRADQIEAARRAEAERERQRQERRWRRAARPDEARERRNREVCRLARAGWTNAELAARFRLSPATICRIYNSRRAAPVNVP